MFRAKGKVERTSGRLADRGGFVMPMVIFALVVMGTVAVAAMLAAGDEQRSSRAVYESGAAFYAAEAGLNQVWATWNDSAVATLEPGDSLDLGWQTLDNGASYRGMIRRYDNWGQELFGLTVEGRGRGPAGGQRVLSLTLTTGTGSLTVDGAFVGMGQLNVGFGGGVVVDGTDNVPPGWGAQCPAPGAAMPGIVMQDTSALTLSGAPTVSGDPPIQENSGFATADFDALWDELVAKATLYPTGTASIGPVENPPGTCDTSVQTNWGAPTNLTHPCFDYFPIIYAENARLKTNNGQSGQGILLVGCQGTKCDLELENGFCFYGLVLVQGEFELEAGAGGNPPCIYGAVMVKNYGDPTKTSKIWTGSTLQYSSCVLQRVSEKTGAGGPGTTKPLASRAFGELLH